MVNHFAMLASSMQHQNEVSQPEQPYEERHTRVWKRIPVVDRLKLEIAVGFGLPTDFAGKVINMSSRNANRIMKESEVRKQKEKGTINSLGEGEKNQEAEFRREVWAEAELEAILAVASAREAGRIRKRNINKLDQKINQHIAKYLSKEAPTFKTTIQEKMLDTAD